MEKESVLIYTIGFFIYLNIKVVLFLAFFRYAKKLMYDRKHSSGKKKKEMTEQELHDWYDKSTFKKVSKVEYSEDMARLMMSMHKSPIPDSANKSKDAQKIQIGDLTIVVGNLPKKKVNCETKKDQGLEKTGEDLEAGKKNEKEGKT
ncbi:hypothetical protein HY745_11015 [Candidatus Desantisbacteria bacterium]|nr:hypothetical protein [Candidatus Desantisbacteria bacterium]